MTFQVRIVMVLGIVFTALLMILAEFHSRQLSFAAYEPNLPRELAAGSPALVGRVVDRDGRTILTRQFVEKAGGRSAVIRYSYGSALGAVSVGQDRIVAGMIRHLRSAGQDAPWSTPELGGVYRNLLGDGALCPRPLPDVLVCSIDASLSLRIYELLQRSGWPAASVVVLNKDGEALSLVDWPGPSVEESEKLPDSLHSLNVFLSTPPASTFKPIVSAYLLQYGKGDINASVECRGNGQCWRKHGVTHGLREALVRSCNPFFRYQSGFMPLGEFYSFLSDVGYFSEPTLGVPTVPAVTPARTSGTVDPETAIGMQILSSPLSLGCAYGTITSPQGRRFSPRLFLKADGRELRTPDQPRVLRPEVTAAMREHLRAVTTYGTAAEIGRLLGRDVGAKTGTAGDAALLAVVYPIDSPEFIVVLRVQGAPSGASLCPIAAEIVHAATEECGPTTR